MFKVLTEVNSSRISDLLCGAFEGGSNYWASSPDNNSHEVGATFAFEAPLKDGGWFFIEDLIDGGLFKITKVELQKGLQVMAADYPWSFSDFIAERDDATAADVYLQCCVFGKVIYS